MQKEPFEHWAIIETFDNPTLAGYISEETIAGVQMLRIDAPIVDDTPGFTKFVGKNAVAGITLVDRNAVETYIKFYRRGPFNCYIAAGIEAKKS